MQSSAAASNLVTNFFCPSRIIECLFCFFLKKMGSNSDRTNLSQNMAALGKRTEWNLTAFEDNRLEGLFSFKYMGVERVCESTNHRHESGRGNETITLKSTNQQINKT
jgi:hypothetical protein